MRGLFLSKDFYNKTSRPYDPASGESPVGNQAMLERQLRRFGFLTGEKSLLGLEKGPQGANVAAATQGSLDAIVVPKGYTLDSQGLLIRSSDGGGTLKYVADKMASIAEFSARTTIFGEKGSQQWAENQNRLSTFEMSFSHAFTGELRRYEYWKDKLSTENKTATDKQIYDAMETSAGNIAQEMVKTLHFDYDNWAKSRILQGPKGKVVGQFQHFKFAFFDLNYQLYKEVARDFKAGVVTDNNPWTGKKQLAQSYQEMTRMAMIYSLIPGLFAAATNFDIGGLFSTAGWDMSAILMGDEPGPRKTENRAGLIDNPIIEDSFKLINYLGADPGDDNYLERKYGTYYGKNPITANMGPFVSDLLTIAELTDFWNQTDEEYEQKKNLNMDLSSSDWWEQIARIFNIQAARTYWHTLPAFLNRDLEKMARIETGAFQPRWISEWRNKVALPAAKEFLGIEQKKRRKKRTRQQILESLDAFSP